MANISYFPKRSTWWRNPFRTMYHWFHPPLPTAQELRVVHRDQTLNEIAAARRQLADLEFKRETQQGLLDMNLKRLKRLDGEDTCQQ